MADDQLSEKTEQPTPRKLEEALGKGQIARSAEIQTAVVLLGGLGALTFAGHDSWKQLVSTTVVSLSHLHDTSLAIDALQGYGISGMFILLRCAGPVVLATMLAGVLVAAIQNRFNTTPEALTIDWARLNPVEGFKRIFSIRSAVPTVTAMIKMTVIILLTYKEIKSVLTDPIFTTSVSVGRMAEFLAETSLRIFLRVSLALLVIAVADYGYQWWRTQQDLMMTKDEVKEEAKNSEGSTSKFKAARRRLKKKKKAQQLAEIARADVVITNPTHIAVALRYDRKTMRAPKVIAKGIRLNALQIREMAKKYQIPIVENKPLARMLFKHAKVDGEVPAQLFAAVAEVLAWVYRVNRYRYYTELNHA